MDVTNETSLVKDYVAFDGPVIKLQKVSKMVKTRPDPFGGLEAQRIQIRTKSFYILHSDIIQTSNIKMPIPYIQ